MDTDSDTNVWVEKYSGTLDDVFEIQESVSRSIVEALHLRLTPQEMGRVSERPIEDVRAYECYLRARHELYLWTEDGLDRAVRSLEAGLELVGDNPLLCATMAHAHWQYVNAGFRPAEHLRVAESWVDRVLALEPDSPHGRRTLGLIDMRTDLQSAVENFKRALAVEPNDPDSLFWLITAYFYSGHVEASMPYVDRLLSIDPLSPLSRSAPGWAHFFEGRFGPALERIRETYQTDPGNPGYRYIYIQMLVYNRRFAEAYELIDQLASDAPGHPFAVMVSMLKAALQGDAAQVEAPLAGPLRDMLRGDVGYSWFVATCYALLGRPEEAVDWLDNAVALGFVNYPFLSRHDHLLDKVRGDARFRALIGRARDVWERFEA